MISDKQVESICFALILISFFAASAYASRQK